MNPNEPKPESAKWINTCHSLSPKRERCTREDGHEGHWHIGMRSRWTTREQHPDSPT